MDVRTQSKAGNGPGGTNTGRRSFMWKAGAAMSAALASVVPGMAGNRASSGNGLDGEVNRLSTKLGMLEDEKAIRSLHQTYQNLLDSGKYEDIAILFTEDGEVVFNGGVFSGRKSGVSRLYRDCFSSGLTGKKLGPAPGLDVVSDQQTEAVNVAANRLSAKAQFPYSIQVGAPMAPDSSLVAMARLHGEGIVKWCESGICEVSYEKSARDGNWKIKRLEYRVASQSDYKPGRSQVSPISVPLFSQTYPDNPAGPDSLIRPA